MSKRWIQFGSAVIAMIMIANLQYAWTLFVGPIRAAHKDWSLPAVQWAFTLFIFLETWITPVEGWLIDRLGPRIFLTLGGLLVGIGWTGMGYAHSLTQLWMLYVAFVLTSIGGLMITAQASPFGKSVAIPAAAIVTALWVSRLANGAGRIVWGLFSDFVGREMAMFIPFVLQALCLVAMLKL